MSNPKPDPTLPVPECGYCLTGYPHHHYPGAPPAPKGEDARLGALSVVHHWQDEYGPCPHEAKTRVAECDECLADAILEFAGPLRNEIEELRRACRTRADYNFRCQDCGAPHNIDTSIPSPIWNAICENRPGVLPGAAGIGMPEVGALCTLCIDERLQKAGLTCNVAEFYFGGSALSSRQYAESTGEIEHLQRTVADLKAQVEALREALEGMVAFADDGAVGAALLMGGLHGIAGTEASRAANAERIAKARAALAAHWEKA